ncbi:MAG: GDSL-type esterase/lipase family protein [Pedobacter sp.]
MKLFRTIVLGLIVFTTTGALAQNKPFWNEIQDFKKQDSTKMPAAGGIVFVGSSSLRMWKNLESFYQSYKAINRGFGGSNLQQANMYINELVFPYKPRQVVIYSGENDIAEGTSAIETLNRLATFFSNIRNRLPEANIVFISIKESPSRAKFSDATVHANRLIKEYLLNYRNTKYIDVNSKMKTADGKLRPELFLKDMLHMQPAGYEIWIKEITPHLLK